MTITIDSSFLEMFLPEGTLNWFEPIKCEKQEDAISLIFEEKNLPPIADKDKGKQIFSKGFYDVTINDFPIRGKAARLTFRRRRWQIEGQKELLKNNIRLSFPGTKLEKEFADFLKEGSGD